MVTSQSVHTCLEAWMRCEHLLAEMARKNMCRDRIAGVVDECALVCMGTFHALRNRSANASRMAVLCVGLCEECAEACDKCQGESFSRCAAACRQCSENMSIVAFAHRN